MKAGDTNTDIAFYSVCTHYTANIQIIQPDSNIID